MKNRKARPPMRRVCILTKEGRQYTPEGLMHISAEIEKRFQVKGPFAGLMGSDFNKPNELLRFLKKNSQKSFTIDEISFIQYPLITNINGI